MKKAGTSMLHLCHAHLVKKSSHIHNQPCATENAWSKQSWQNHFLLHREPPNPANAIDFGIPYLATDFSYSGLDCHYIYNKV